MIKDVILITVGEMFQMISLFFSFWMAMGVDTSAWAQGASVYLEKITDAELPAMAIDTDTIGGDSKAALETALQKQLQRCSTQSGSDTWNFAGEKITRQQWCIRTTQWFLAKLKVSTSLEEVYSAARKELRWFRSRNVAAPSFAPAEPMRLSESVLNLLFLDSETTSSELVAPKGPNDVLYTGYFHPSLKAKRVKDAVYRFPIYRMPSGNAHYTRAEIVAGAFDGKGLEIAYASNPVDPFLLEIQGSGALMIQNDDGTETRILANYAGSNKYAYTSLGKVMRNAGLPEEYISMQGIRRYFIDEHPEQWEKFSNQNQSYVFFREDTNGPYGSSGVILTPGHSIAVDTKIFPMGAVTLVQSERPVNRTGSEVVAWQPFIQFMISQDTGGAIKGAAHVDIYWGNGEYAELTAGHSQQIGKLYFCLAP